MLSSRSLWARWLRSLSSRLGFRSASKPNLRLETLEDRSVPAAIPTIQGLTNQTILLGQQATFNASFANTGDQIGYGPVMDVVLDTSGPDGATSLPTDGYGNPTVTVAGLTLSPVATIVLGPSQTSYTNPLTSQIVSVPAGFGNRDTVYIYALPFGSFTPAQTTGVTISAATSNLADVNTPLPIAILPSFRDNEPSLNGPPIAGTVQTAATTPELWRLTKTYLGPESETATGPNYTREYRLDLDIATGQRIDATTIRDLLPPSMQFVQVVSASVQGNAASPTLTLPSRTVPGGDLFANFGTVTGIDGNDVSLTFRFYVPRDAAGGGAVVPQGTDSTTGVNRSSATGNWLPIDPRDRGPGGSTIPVAIVQDTNGTTHTLQQHSLATQKSLALFNALTGAAVANNASDPAQPGGTLVRYTINFQVSDYFAFQNLTLQDILSDGQRLYLGPLPGSLGSSTPTLSVNNAFNVGSPGTRGNTSGAFTSGGVINYSRNFTTGDSAADPTSYSPTGGPSASIFNNAVGASIDGTTGLTFNISQELIARGFSGRLVGGDVPNAGGAPQNNNPFAPTPTSTVSGGPVTGTITFWAELRENFSDDFPSGNPSIGQGDRLENQVPLIRGDQINTSQINAANPTVIGTGTDDSGTSFVLPYGNISKNVYAINGTTVPPAGFDSPRSIQAGDRVTYKLTYTLPISSYEQLRLTDFPPLPIMPVGPDFQYNFDGTTPTFGPYSVAIAPDDTFFSTLGILNPLAIRAATNGPITATYSTSPSNGQFNGVLPSTVDGVTLVVGDRVMVRNQTNPAQNGIYIVNSATQWTRDAAFNSVAEVANASLFRIQSGTINGGRAFVQDNQAFTNFNGSGPSSAISLAPWITTNEPNNGVSFDFGAFSDAGNYRNTTISLLLTLPVGSQAFASDLFLTNQFRVEEGSTNQGETTAESIQPLDLVRPVVTLNKGVVGDTRNGGYSLGGISFNAPGAATTFTGGPIFNATQAGAIGASNGQTLDGGDRARFALVVQNTGRGDAYDVIVSDTFSTGYDAPASAATFLTETGLSVRRGDGTALSNGALVNEFARVATSANISNLAATPATQAGVQLQLNDLVLVRAQTTASQNGLYRVSAVNTGGSVTLTLVPGSTASGFRVAVLGGTLGATSNTGRVFEGNGSGGWADQGGTAEFFYTYDPTARTFRVSPNDNYSAGNTNAETLDNRTGGISRGASGTSAAPVPVTNGSNTLVITYDLRLNPATTTPPPSSDRTVNAGERLRNTAQVTNTANSDAGVNLYDPVNVPGAVAPQDTAEVPVASPELTKTLVGTSIVQGNNTNTTAVIGELATYQLTVRVPEGVTNGFKIVDLLPAGMAFVDVQSVSFDPNISSTLTPGTGTAPANVSVANSGGQVTFDFGNVTNSNNTANGTNPNNRITIVFRAVVLNTSGNVAGTSLVNRASGEFDDAAGNDLSTGLISAPAVSVIEPRITAAKSYTLSGTGANTGNGTSNGVAQSGNTVTYTLRITNPSANSTRANEVTISDPLPTTAVTFGTTIGYTGPSRFSASNFQISSGNLQTISPLGFLDPGEEIVLTVTGTLTNNVTPNQLVGNTITERWTSLSGTPGVLSSYNANAVERTGNPSDPGELNNYQATATANFNVSVPAPVKSIVSTSEGSTTGSNVAVGEVVRYRLQIRIPRATIPDASLLDSLPAGMLFLNDGTARVAIVANDTSKITVPSALSGAVVTGDQTTVASITPTFALPSANIVNATSPGNPFAEGHDPRFVFGNVINNNDEITSAGLQEFAIVEFNALVMNVAGNTSGVTRNNTFQAFTGTTAAGSPSAAVPVTVVEPRVTVTKTANPTSGDAGNAIRYTITLNNTGNATAFNTTLSDVIPAAVGSPTLFSVSGGGLTTSDFSITGQTLSTASAAGVTLAPNAVVTILVDGTLTTAVNPGQQITNTANIVYTSLPGTNGTTTNPTGSSTPGTPGVNTGERTGTGGVNNYAANGSVTTSVPVPALAKSLFATSFAGTTGSNVTLGETVTYALRVTLPEGTTPDLVITDTLPAGLIFDSSSVITTAAASGGLLTADFNGTLTAPSVTLSAGNPSFTFTSILTADDNVTTNNSFLILVTARVADVVGNVGVGTQTVLPNTAAGNYGGTNPGTIAPTPAVNVTVVEPRVVVTKADSPTTVDAGDTVTVTLTAQNTGTSASYDTVVRTQLPAQYDFTTVNFGTAGVNYPTGWTPAIDTTTGVIIYSAGSGVELNPSVTATFRFTAVLNGTVTPNQNIPNSVQATQVTSLPGDVAGERNTPSNVANASVNVPNASVVKSIVATSLAATPGTNVAIGEQVTYEVAVTLPEGTTPTLTLTDTLPTGVTFLTGTVLVDGTGFGGTLPAAAPTVNLSGNTLTVTFGSPISVDGDNVTTNNTFRIRYQVRVADVAGNTNGTNLVNSVRGQVGTGPQTPPATTTATVVEPRLTALKTLVNSDTTVDAGTTMTYRITVSNLSANGSTGPAYNVAITDALAARGLTLLPGTVSLFSAPGYVTLGNASTASDLTATLNELRLGDSVTIEFQTTLNGPAASGVVPAPGATVVNTAGVAYDTAPTNGRPETPLTTNQASFQVNTYSVSGNTYRDLDNDGLYEPGAGETLITGINITYRLIGTDAQGVAVDRELTTNTGTYSFTDLRPGNYRVVQVNQPGGLLDGRDTAGTPFGGVNNTPNPAKSDALLGTVGGVITTLAIPLNAPQNGVANAGVNYNFGELPPASLGNRVWEDLNGNGRQDTGEPGIDGVSVSLSGTDTFGNPITQTTTTAAGGAYAFNNLTPGTYTVTFGNSDGTTTYARTVQNSSVASEATNSDANVTTGQTAPVTLVAGQNNPDIDAGLYRPITIGDTVFYDTDGDGTQAGANEPGIPGVTVRLFYAGVDGVLDPADLTTPVATTVTDSNGNYTFANRIPGTYRVIVDDGTLPNGLTIATTPNGQNSVTTSGNDDLDRDFGFRGTASLGDRVWLDANADGVQQGGEPGIPGVIVTATWLGFDGVLGTSDDVTYTDVTDSTGAYRFTGLPSGDFVVEVDATTLPPGYTPTYDLDGLDTPNIARRTLAEEEDATDVDFGYRGDVTLSGTVYVDRNNNGVQDPGEIPLQGVTLTLTGTDNLGSPITLIVTTATDGTYTFSGMLPGIYTVTQTQPVGYASGIVTPGTAGGTATPPPGNVISNIVLGAGTNATGYNFGELASSLNGRVYADNNLNAVYNADTDRPISGVTVRLQDNATGQIVRTTTTATDGTYAFLDLPAGNYTVIETQPPFPTTRIPPNADPLTFVGSEFFDGADNPGNLGGDVVASGPGKNEIRNITLGLAQDGVDYNFGELPPADPFGFVYIDANNNGSRDVGEIGIPNVTITISGTAFAGTPFARPLVPGDLPGNSLSVLTDANGRYEFNPMPPGVYQIVQTQPPGFIDGLEENADPNGPNTVIVGNDIFENVVLNPFPIRGPFNFGELGNQGEIRGSVYVDRNNNGRRDAGEIGIPGVTVRISGIDLAGRAVSATVVTDAAGNYVFRKMSAGTYRISEVQPREFLDGIDRAGTAGGQATNDVISNVNLGVNQIATGYLFGERGLNPNMVSKQQFLASSQTIMNRRPGSGIAFLNPPGDPSGYVYLDANNNGRRDAGEQGIRGAQVILTGLTFDGQRFRDVQFTNAEGFYEWDNLLPGTYAVQLVQPSNFVRGRQSLGSLGGIIGPNLFRSIVVRSGDRGVNYNFGQLPPRTPMAANATAAQVSSLASSVALITPPLYPDLVARYTTQRRG